MFPKIADPEYMQYWQRKDGLDIWMPRWEGNPSTECVASESDILII